jgi:coniferyl-aldehyde dehydrogenase
MATPHVIESGTRSGAEALFQGQRAAALAEGSPGVRLRRDRLSRAIDLLVSSQRQLCETLSHDFGQRPIQISRFLDILPAVHALKLARRRLHHWMRPKRARLGLPLGIPGASGHMVHEPLGVVGVISPWNFPITLSFGPLAGIFAAGNRCLIKPSELTPATSDLMQNLVARHFDSRELVVVTGGPEVAEAFARLPLDHLLFTGSAAVGRRVMAAAAEHLVPVTLELGGKCPVVVGRSANLEQAVDRILLAKTANAGQICLAPDYVCLPRESLESFVLHARRWAARAYPGLPTNSDYTSIVSARHARRIEDLVANAIGKGATIIRLTDDPAARSNDARLIPPALVIGATDDMALMQEEIFGPLLPLQPYERLDEVIANINRRPRPLALYYFGNDGAEEREVLARTSSGGVTVNDIAMHYFAEELPFGGIGASGMGEYHGEYGFRRFSHTRPVLNMPRWDTAGLLGLRPPYRNRLRIWLDFLIRR